MTSREQTTTVRLEACRRKTFLCDEMSTVRDLDTVCRKDGEVEVAVVVVRVQELFLGGLVRL